MTTTNSTISWGRHERYKFTAYGGLTEWVPPVTPAVFAVTYRRDPQNKPKGHTVLLFGECDDMAQHAMSIKRQIMEVWSDNGGTIDDLYVFVHAMPGSTKSERSRIKETLVLEYQPQANNAYA